MKYKKKKKPRLHINPLALRKIIKGCIAGKVSDRTALYNNFKRLIYSTIRDTLKSKYRTLLARQHIEAIAGDVLISLFDKSCKALTNLKTIEAFSVYLYRIAHHRTIDYIRNHTLYRKAVTLESCEGQLTEDAHTEPEICIHETLEEKKKALKLLEKFLAEKVTKNEQRIIELKYVDGKSNIDIGLETGKTPNSVGVAIARILRKGKKYFDLKGTDIDTQNIFSQFLLKTFKENPDKTYVLLAKLAKEDNLVCPSDELFINYLSDNIDHPRREFIEAHLKACGKCRHSVRTGKRLLTKFFQNSLSKVPKSMDAYIHANVLNIPLK